MTAINNDIRGKITHAALKHGMREHLVGLLAIEGPLSLRLYERIYPADTIAAINLLTERHTGSTYWRRTLPVNVGGAKIILGRDSSASSREGMHYLMPSDVEQPGFRVPYCDRSSTDALIELDADDPMGQEIMAYGQRRVELNEYIGTKRAEIVGVLSEIRSDRQLRERWPEIMPLAAEFLKASQKIQLPAVPVADLNASLGLPPMKEAA